MTENPGNAPLRPAEVEPDAPEAADGQPKRTDPRTFIVQALQVIPRTILPLGALAFAMRDEITLTEYNDMKDPDRRERRLAAEATYPLPEPLYTCVI